MLRSSGQLFLRSSGLVGRSTTTHHSRSLQRTLSPRRGLSSLAASATGHTAAPSGSTNNAMMMGTAAGAFLLAGLHSATGSQTDFFDYRFITEKDPEDLASFYGGEEFMELFCIFPFVGQLMMRNGEFDDKGDVFTTGLPGTLKVSMVFSDDTNDESGTTEWFNKRERFRDTCMGLTCWDMVQNFGFRTLDDGRIEVYHYGEYFHGNLPVVSQIMRLVFKVHARWLAWSTEHHVNHYAFSETEEEEPLEEESRRNMPFFLLKNYAWSDLMAMLFGHTVDKPSFLVKDKGDQDGDESQSKLLPTQQVATKLQIGQDIAADRLTTRSILLARHETMKEASEDQSNQSSVSESGSSSSSTTTRAVQETKTTYAAATEAARLRHLTRRATLERQNSLRSSPRSAAQ